MSGDYYKEGDYNVICDYSGFKAKASECKMTWNGYFVLKRFWERRHPQDFLRGKEEDQSVPNPRPRAAFSFIDDTIQEIKPEDL